MSKFFVIGMITIVVSVALAAGNPVPQGADLDRFPILSGPLSTRQMADMGLRPTRLGKSEDFLNYDRSHKVFELSTINVGEVVLVDDAGIVRYKASCGNRLAAVCAPGPTLPQLPPPECHPIPRFTLFAFWLEEHTVWGWLGLFVPAMFLLMALALLVVLFVAAIGALRPHRHHRRVRYGWCYRCGRHHWFRT